MGITVKVVAECDMCKAISSDVSTLVGGAIKLPDGWVNNTSLGILCVSCKKRLDTEKDAYDKIYKANEKQPSLMPLLKEYYDNKNVRSLKHEHENRADSN